MFRASEGTFTTFDRTTLFYRSWEPLQPTDKTVIILHRGHEHSGRVAHLVKELQLENVRYFAFDLRGHGMSPGPRGWAPSFNTWVKDLNSFSLFLRGQHQVDISKTCVVANSVGSVMALQWVQDYAPGIRAMVLAAPALSINLYVPFALSFLRCVTWFTNKAYVSSYVRSGLLTRDPEEAAAYDKDRLITKRIAVSVLVTLFDNAKRLLKNAASIETPTLILSAGSDFIVRNTVQKKFFDAMVGDKNKFVTLKGFRHALFHEKDREQVLAPARSFLAAQFGEPSRNLPALIPQARSFSEKQFLSLKAKPSRFAALGYFLSRKGLETVGSLSDGVAIGLHHGFDSGTSLDYVYRNQPKGKWLIGTLIDWVYLRSTGWKGIRNRKVEIKRTIIKTITELHQSGQKPVLMDCAAGHGRYVLEAVKESGVPVEVHLRDIVPYNLESARRIASELQLKDVHFEITDAFESTSYNNLGYKPNIAIVSGLFELFPANSLPAAALSGVKNVLQQGGYLIYTGQPWHPQLEFIARVLNNHLGFRWIMRVRVQAELDELVRYVGFKKIDTAIEDLGIFTVSLAKNA